MTEMTPNPEARTTISLRHFDAFAEISEIAEQELQTELQLLNFRIGQNLTSANIIPAKVFVLIQGHCRLLGSENGRLCAFARLGPGSILGLASLLRAEPCEAITATCDVVTAAIPDQLIIDLYLKESSFRSWCDRNLWASEIAALLESIEKSNAQSDISVRKKLPQAVQQAKLLPNQTLNDPQALKSAAAGRILYLASANSKEKIGTVINPVNPLPQVQPPFPLRVISLPNGLGEPNTSSPESAQKTALAGVKSAPERPERSSLLVGQANHLSDFKLIRSEGVLGETLACFQMLAEHCLFLS